MPKTSVARKSTPHPAPDAGTQQNRRSNTEDAFYQQSLFLSMALNMTWQLALVVLVPIVGGYMLDQHYHTSPWLTVVGAVVGMLGVAGVLYRIVAEAGRRSGLSEPRRKR